MPGIEYSELWFVLVGVLLAGYAMLDGFDLGVGALHLLNKDDNERRIMLNSIGPVWDGNEVWLVTGGGALFAAFPDVYATVFSGFYTAFMLLLFVLIFRAVAIEFRSKQEMKWWRSMWDKAFSFSSIFIALLMGIALGNMVQGVPLAPDKEFYGSFFDMITPYTLMVGLTTLALFMMHGAIYATMKTDGALQYKLRSWINNTIIFFVMCYGITTVTTLIFLPHMTDSIREQPSFFVVALINMLAIANIPREIHNGREFMAFLSSCVVVLTLMALFAIGLFPNLVYSNPHPEYSLTVYNASSSEKTLTTMSIMALIGIPFVLAYTISIYWIFRGKVKLDSMSY